MQKIIPSFLVSKKNTVLFMIFVFFFSVLFLNIYEPSFISQIYNIENATGTQKFFTILIFVLCGIAVLIVSRLVIYFLKNKIKITYFVYSGWIFGEILIMSVLYTLVMKIKFNDTRDFFEIAPLALLYISLILFLPYMLLRN